ncbi:MAG: helix-turn-helix transcriptional regulator [Oscillospiraceae bacterium]|nr:helix-turn-helix transcriptional regulator [Oscillospiraceae bacterium]
MIREIYEEHVTHGTADFPVGIYDNHFPAGISELFPLHYHKQFEFLVMTEGASMLQLENETIPLHKGEGVFINSGTLHHAVPADNSECSFAAIVFSPEFIAAKHEELYDRYIRSVIQKELAVPLMLTDDIKNLILNTNELFKSQRFGTELLIKSNIIRMTAMCIMAAERRRETKHDIKSDIVKNVLDYIHNNYAAPISLYDLASRSHISKEHLCRVFKERADYSPIVYLNRYRIMQSAYMLRSTDKSVSEIAFTCGFNNSSYFNKLFMRFMNCSPTDYRRNVDIMYSAN